MVLAWESCAQAVVWLTTADLAGREAIAGEQRAAERFAPGVPVACVSATGAPGTDELEPHLPPGSVAVLLGASGAGKSTVAVAAEAALIQRGHLAYVLDGDNIRHGLNKNLGFSPEDLTENNRRIGAVAKRFTDADVIVFTTINSP